MTSNGPLVQVILLRSDCSHDLVESIYSSKLAAMGMLAGAFLFEKLGSASVPR